MRDLLTESGSIFVQIGDENVHRVRAVMDEVFGAENFRRCKFRLKDYRRQTSDLIAEHQLINCFGMRKIEAQSKYRHLYH